MNWIKIEDGCEMPEHGERVIVAWGGNMPWAAVWYDERNPWPGRATHWARVEMPKAAAALVLCDCACDECIESTDDPEPCVHASAAEPDTCVHATPHRHDEVQCRRTVCGWTGEDCQYVPVESDGPNGD